MFRLTNKHRSIQDFKFCENQNLINRLLESLVFCKIQDDDIDDKLYINDLTGQKWELNEHDDEIRQHADCFWKMNGNE